MCPPFAISHKKAASNGSIAADRLIFGRPIPSPSLSRGRTSMPDLRRCVKASSSHLPVNIYAPASRMMCQTITNLLPSGSDYEKAYPRNTSRHRGRFICCTG